MTKKIKIIVSVLLIISAILIGIFLKDPKPDSGIDLVGFFTGALSCGGFFMLFNSFVEKKKK